MLRTCPQTIIVIFAVCRFIAIWGSFRAFATAWRVRPFNFVYFNYTIIRLFRVFIIQCTITFLVISKSAYFTVCILSNFNCMLILGGF